MTSRPGSLIADRESASKRWNQELYRGLGFFRLTTPTVTKREDYMRSTAQPSCKISGLRRRAASVAGLVVARADFGAKQERKRQIPAVVLASVLFTSLVFQVACGGSSGTGGSSGSSGTPAVTFTFSVLYSFTGGTDGGNPEAGLVRDTAGNLYGTTSSGGASNQGTVFKLDTTGKETVLHSFTGGADGGFLVGFPMGGVILDAAGNLYGTTPSGGASNQGTVFKLDTTGTETVLYSFTGGTDGVGPRQVWCGTRRGTSTVPPTGAALRPAPDGTAFKLDTTGTETVLYSFTGGAADGGISLGGLILDASGNLYGTTSAGGASSAGTVFKLDTTGKETVLYSFVGGERTGRVPRQVWSATRGEPLRYHFQCRRLESRDGVQVGYDWHRNCPAQLYGRGGRGICGECFHRRLDPRRGGQPLRHHLRWRRFRTWERCSRWIRPARRPCCTPSRARRTEKFPWQVWCRTQRVIYTAPHPLAAPLRAREREWCSSSLHTDRTRRERRSGQ